MSESTNRQAEAITHAALAAVAQSMQVARRVQQALQQAHRLDKADRSPVTVADFAVQAVVAMALRERFGRPNIVGEEHAHELRQSEQGTLRQAVVDAVQTVRPEATEDDVLQAIDACDHDGSAAGYWTLDPVDGTKGFLRQQQYAIALAWIEHGEVVLGVMGCPNLPAAFDRPLDEADPAGTLYLARRGEGAFEVPVEGDLAARKPIRSTHWEAGSPVRVCESVEKAHSKQDATQRILDALGEAGEPVRLDSQCKYAVVARGQADAYLRLPTRPGYVEKVWDHAAGMLIASEAGAVVSDIAGRSLDFTCGERLERNRGVICAAPGLHERIIGTIERLGLVRDGE